MRNILLIISLLLVIGCGTRKVIKTEYDLKMKEQVSFKDSIYKQNLFIGVKVDTSSIWSVEYEPIDSSKVMIVDKVNNRYQNVRFKTQKVKNGISISKTKNNVLKSTKTINKEKEIDYSKDEKEVETKTYFSYWWILIVIMGAGILYADYKRW